MPTQTHFGGGSSGLSWSQFFHGLQHGHLSAWILLIGLAAAMTVTFWAGNNLMKKDTGR